VLEQTSGEGCSSDASRDSTESGALSFANFTSEQFLLFNVKINLGCGAVFDDLLPVQFHF
jgi:hypothetical protein